ncbi:MAG: hypothetical protein K9N23_16630 [Akkermansiaceae bacterium]|nr:hypothetical protein [Akkermansiaceae bacterium]
MPGLRDQLFELGWQQGSIIDAGRIDHPALAGADPFLVINQTCDLIHDRLETEPSAELLRLRRIEEVDPALENTKNPRKAHILALHQGTPAPVEISCVDRITIPRDLLLGGRPSTSWQVAAADISDLIVWFTQRYLRTAFPNSFEDRIKPQLKKIRKQIEPNQSLIDTLFIRVDPLREISGDDPHAVRLLVAVRKANLDDPVKLQMLHSMAKQLGSIFGEAEGLELEGPVIVESLNNISLAQIQDYLEWCRYDYLSFGEED